MSGDNVWSGLNFRSMSAWTDFAYLSSLSLKVWELRIQRVSEDSSEPEVRSLYFQLLQ